MDEQYKDIVDRLRRLEEHVINLIVPLQQLNTFLTNKDIYGNLKQILAEPLIIDDRNLVSILQSIQQSAREYRDDINKIDLSHTLGEIKYIGKRLDLIEKNLWEMKDKGISKKIDLEFIVDGCPMIRKPSEKVSDQPVRLYKELNSILCEILTDQQHTSIIHRFGLFGETQKTIKEISELMGIGVSVVRTHIQTALRKLSLKQFEYLTKDIQHIGLIESIEKYKRHR